MPIPSAPNPPPTATPKSPPEALDVVLSVEGVTQAFGSKRVLHDVHVRVARGQVAALVGPSGSGKSTLLRAILGTHPAREGRVLMDGKPLRRASRNVGIVYQRYTLFPFLTALQNVAFGLMLDATTPLTRAMFWSYRALRRDHLDRAEAALRRVGLGSALHLYPAEMSGGMCQRVAIAQALVLRPKLLLLDEPFGALDEAMREDLQEMLLELYAENLAALRNGAAPPYTIIIVTHELNEALFVADRVIGLSQYWRYEDDGHAKPPGATIVYDKAAPVFSPGDVLPFDRLREQKLEIRRVVMEPEPRFPRRQHVLFWDQVAQGQVEGVLALARPAPAPRQPHPSPS